MQKVNVPVLNSEKRFDALTVYFRITNKLLFLPFLFLEWSCHKTFIIHLCDRLAYRQNESVIYSQLDSSSIAARVIS